MLKFAVTVSLMLIGLAVRRRTLGATSSSSKPVHLTCESLVTPLGMDEPSPALSWRLEDSRPGRCPKRL
jgi:alpha-L-rhamnosidase